MSEKILVIGCGSHSRFILSLLTDINKYQISGLIETNNSFVKDEKILNFPVIGSINNIKLQSTKNVVLAVGSNTIRRKLYLKLKKLGFNFPNIIHPKASISDFSLCGEGNVIGPSAVLGADVKIGSNNLLNSGCIIEHNSIIGNHCHISLGSVVAGSVLIDDEVMLGANSSVLDKLKVKKGTILGANSLLTRSTSRKNLKLVGSPAKAI